MSDGFKCVVSLLTGRHNGEQQSLDRIPGDLCEVQQLSFLEKTFLEKSPVVLQLLCMRRDTNCLSADKGEQDAVLQLQCNDGGSS